MLKMLKHYELLNHFISAQNDFRKLFWGWGCTREHTVRYNREHIYITKSIPMCLKTTLDQPHMFSTVICREITWTPAWQSWRSKDVGTFSSRFRVTHWFLFLEVF